jgi:hypothetical protein
MQQDITFTDKSGNEGSIPAYNLTNIITGMIQMDYLDMSLDMMKNMLWDMNHGEYEDIVLAGRMHSEHRPSSLFTSKPDIKFSYSGLTAKSVGTIESCPLIQVCHSIATNLLCEGVDFNAAFVNWYKDGSEYIGTHNDDLSSCVPGTPIVSMIFLIYEEDHTLIRDFTINDFKSCSIIKKLQLFDCSCIVIPADINAGFKHGVPKRSGKYAKRMNITFRSFKV